MPNTDARETCFVTIKLSTAMVMKLKAMLHIEPTFHSFPKLPAELRVMIWKCAAYIQDRIVTLWVDERDEGDPTASLRIMRAPMPRIFLVNQEAYAETRKLYVHMAPNFMPYLERRSTGPLISFENDIFVFPQFKFRDFSVGVRDLGVSWIGAYAREAGDMSFRRISLLMAVELEAGNSDKVSWLQAIDTCHHHAQRHASFAWRDLDVFGSRSERRLERYRKTTLDNSKCMWAVARSPTDRRELLQAEWFRWMAGVKQLVDDHDFQWYRERGIHLPQLMFDGNGCVIYTSTEEWDRYAETRLNLSLTTR
ncbi:hypothetical protein F5Y03DRAFT_396097 [Xylaria venustula]|nr:hypothetical protein F5Y03DRAFT_396097 [Xylaria venustula]